MASTDKEQPVTRPDWRERLDEMVRNGEATYHPGTYKPGSGAELPEIKLTKPVKDFRRIARAAKSL